MDLINNNKITNTYPLIIELINQTPIMVLAESFESDQFRKCL